MGSFAIQFNSLKGVSAKLSGRFLHEPIVVPALDVQWPLLD
jgi:hypothetical protein